MTNSASPAGQISSDDPTTRLTRWKIGAMPCGGREAISHCDPVFWQRTDAAPCVGDMNVIRIGVDFGGTKIEAAALNANGDFLARYRVPNPGSYDAALAAIAELVSRVELESGGRGTVGVGAPGSVSPLTGVVRNANSVWLNGKRFREDLENALDRPVRLANDANCMALSEATDGAALGYHACFGVIIGTGCGGGFVIDGRLVEGANGIAGEWGHISLPWPEEDDLPAPACWCGQSGCIETWASGTGLRRDFAARTGQSATGEEIISAARAGDADASAALRRLIHRLGRALAMIANIVDPDIFVFGGGLSNISEIYQSLPAVIEQYSFSDNWSARLAPAKWGDSSGVRGAARLWPLHQHIENGPAGIFA